MIEFLLRKLRLNRLAAERNRRARETEIEEPFISELYNADQMEQHGQLARCRITSNAPTHGRTACCPPGGQRTHSGPTSKLLTDAIAADRRITPAGDWLLDNFYLIQEQIRTARRHLPKRYSWELPQLESGFPRVYDIAARSHRPRRRPRHGRQPQRIRLGVSARHYADHRRTVGHSDHAAPGADRKPAPRRRAHLHRSHRTAISPIRGRTVSSMWSSAIRRA